jgi:ABC-2 type transport system permease protein
VSPGKFLAVAGVEYVKLAGQLKTRVLLAACLVSPFAFALAMVLQSSLPEDTLFGRAVKDSGFALPLVVLGFAALWVFPAVTSVVAGDIYSAEDRYGTWASVLTRSCSRSDVFVGKVLMALAFSLIAVAVLAMSSVVAGALFIGRQPLIGLSGALVPPTQALFRVTLAWLSVLPPAFAFTAVAVLTSIATRSSAAGIGLPVVVGLLLQVAAFVDGSEAIRRLLITTAFGAWHGLMTEPPHYQPLVTGSIVSGVYFVVCLMFAYRLLRRRDVGA